MVAVLAAVDWDAGFDDAWTRFAAFVPKFVGFLLILVIGWFVAKAIAKIFDAVLERVGFDRAVERGGVKRALESSKYDASDLVGKVVFYALFLIVLQLAFGVFGPNPVSDLIAGVIAYLPRVIVAIVIVVVASAIAAAAKELIQSSLGGLDYGRLLANVASVAIIAVGVFAALNQLQIAPAIVNGLFYAILAVVAGSAIIAIGGGGVQPMQERWRAALARYDEEKPRLREHRRASERTRFGEVRGEAHSDMAHSGTTEERPLVTERGSRDGRLNPS